MNRTRQKKSEYVGVHCDAEMRAAIEREAAARDMPMSSVVRSLVRAQLDAMKNGAAQQAAA